MSLAERFWWGLTILCVVWYSTVTFLVAWRGAADIKHMLRRLEASNQDAGDSPKDA